MRGLSFRSRSREEYQALETPPPAAPFPRSSSTAGASGIGAALSLGGLGIAAAATIAAFFGIGLSLLIEHPVRIVRPGPATPAVAQTASAPVRPAFEAGLAAPAAQAGPLAPSRQAGGPPAPTAAPPAIKLPSVGQLRSDAAPKTAAITTPRPAAQAFSGDARTSEPEAHSIAAPSAPAASAPPQPETKPAETKPAAARVAEPEPHPAAPAPAAGSAVPATREAVASAPPSTEIAALLKQGDDAFRDGDLTSARLYYLRAFAVGEGRGALGIGATYDPAFLRRFHLWTERADPSEARVWYLRARDLGSSEAEKRLAKLRAISSR